MYGLNVNFKTIFFRQNAKNSVQEKSGGANGRFPPTLYPLPDVFEYPAPTIPTPLCNVTYYSSGPCPNLVTKSLLYLTIPSFWPDYTYGHDFLYFTINESTFDADEELPNFRKKFF